jgi:hypothetical protein
MNAIYNEGTEDTPKIILDREKGIFEFSGRSLPENPMRFYQPVQRWVEAYVLDPNPETEVVVNFDYFNSSSTLQIFEILLTFQKILMTGKSVKIVWCHDKNDEFMESEGHELQSLLEVPFELKSY